MKPKQVMWPLAKKNKNSNGARRIERDWRGIGHLKLEINIATVGVFVDPQSKIMENKRKQKANIFMCLAVPPRLPLVTEALVLCVYLS